MMENVSGEDLINPKSHFIKIPEISKSEISQILKIITFQIEIL